MIILGIDPGSIKTGWAALRVTNENNHPKLIGSGSIITSSTTPFLERLQKIHYSFHQIIDHFKPQQVAFESLIFVKSPQALIKLSQTRGLLIASLYQKQIFSIYEYSPNLIKNITSGHGHATKENISLIMSKLFPNLESKSFDETDAISVALCHYLHLNTSTHQVNQLNIKPSNPLHEKRKKGSSLTSSLKHKINM